jgi:leucyl-tRNA---protein transferase
MQNISIGLTHESPCSYLSDQQERVAIAIEPELHTPHHYEMLLSNGFRRSGETIYTPYCVHCSACQSIRIPIANFVASKSQKRLRNKAKYLHWSVKDDMDEGWFQLYEDYICQRHRNGSMYPPDKEEFSTFSMNSWLSTKFIHIYDNEQLIGIAITDITPNSASSFYTFYNPNHPLSIGTLGVLFQLEFCKKLGKTWLYLGYQIDACPAMNYKVRFHPHQKLVNRRWQG